MDEERTYDVGDNLEELGFAYLFFRYVWPVIIGAIVIAALGFFLLRFVGIVTRFPAVGPI